jgi:ketosteroid isomerase-like protein
MVVMGDHVIATAQRSGVGEHSGLAVSDTVIQVFSFDGDTCVRVQEFYDRADALRSVGAEELAES